jgi:chorismate mutase/prephenate dehydratase
MEDLNALRTQINEIDEALVELFKKRMEIVYKVAQYKIDNSMEVLDRSREEQIINKHLNNIEDANSKAEIHEFLEDLLSISRKAQLKLIHNNVKENKIKSENLLGKVGYQGVPASFSHQAVIEYFGEKAETTNYTSFKEVFEAIQNNEIKYGVLPIENSSTGGISEVYDLLGEYGCYIVGEKCIKVEHNLLGIKGADISDIKEVYSHTQGFLQCKSYFDNYPDWRLIPYFNTAKSAEYVSKENIKSKACVASKKAAEMYNLNIIKENINYNSNNYTRFIIIGKEINLSKQCDKISVAITMPHKSGALYSILKHFTDKNLNMLKIESRPIADKSWEYSFYIDLHGNIMDESTSNVLGCIKKESLDYKLLGNYISEVN